MSNQATNLESNGESSVGDLKRGTGLLIVEVRNSNPNGDPDREGDPRQRPDRLGEISPVSFKRKLRDLVEWKGEVWQELAQQFDPKLVDNKYQILESRGRKRDEIVRKLLGDGKAFKMAYWDGRVFGNTFLESMKEDEGKLKLNDTEKIEYKRNAIKTGVVHFGIGLSVAPIDIRRHTNTNKAGVEEGKDRGMAPMGYRFVEHGLYCMPFFVNPSMAEKTGCTKQDIELLLKLIPYAYPHTRSHARPAVDLVHAWYVEHGNKLGSCSDFAILDALKPRKIGKPDEPSKSVEEYDIPPGLPPVLMNKVGKDENPALNCRDLLEEM